MLRPSCSAPTSILSHMAAGFDGTIGVLGGLEAVQTMMEQGIEPDVPVEVMSFCDEEGHRFGVGLFGSRGILGQARTG